MTHKRTTTDVVLRTYPARFGYAPARALVDFSTGPKQWHITGHWTMSETVSRRKMWTLRRDILADNPGTSDDWSGALPLRYPGIVQNTQQSGASALGAVLVRVGGSEAVILVLEEYPRGQRRR